MSSEALLGMFLVKSFVKDMLSWNLKLRLTKRIEWNKKKKEEQKRIFFI